MVGVWLVVLASSSILYGKEPRLIVKKTNRVTQAVKKKGPVAFSLSTLRNMICAVLGCCGTKQDFYRRLGLGTVRNLLVSVGF